MPKSKLKMGMVGGGTGAFIGAVHRNAAFLDGHIDLHCGAFSSDKEKSVLSGREFYLNSSQCYSSYEEMILKEKNKDEKERMDFVSIVTPNYLHYPIAKMALENGFHVITDKPVTLNLKEALSLKQIVDKTQLLFTITHAYSSYPLVKEAKYLVQKGAIGSIRKVIVEYPQGWLSTELEKGDHKQASWRLDPSKSGISCCMGDIGTHCENLVEEVTGLKIEEVFADLSSFVEGRALDDDGNVLIRLENGAKGVLHASQIACGEENNLSIRVYGTKGALEWHQQEPNTLIRRYLDKPYEVIRAGSGYLHTSANHYTRLPSGHPEGLIEAFANIYSSFARCVQMTKNGKKIKALDLDFPNIDDGVRGMLFVEKVVESSQKQKWIKLQL